MITIKPIIRYNKITKAYGDLKVLKGIDFEIYPGEKVALIGPSGSGENDFSQTFNDIGRTVIRYD